MEVNSSVPPENDSASGGLHHLTSTSIPRRSPHQSPIRPGLVPTYFPVNTIIEKKEDNPGPRCGHTLTAVAAVGEEGSPGYIGPRLILFGGATALENNATTSGALSSPGSSSIRLAGATADVHCYDISSKKWSRITPLGEPPTPRAAHVAAAVGTMVVIQGGIGPAGLSSEDLHALDLTQQQPRWHKVAVQGSGPGPRYGHVMALVGQRFLMAIGGNDGNSCMYFRKRPLADVWALDTSAKPYKWLKLEPEGEGPPPCMLPLASAYGLVRDRDGHWAWAIALGVSPSPRYQHAAVFVHAQLHVSGGALGGGRMVEDRSSIAVLDTAAGVWCDTKAIVTSARAGRYSANATGGDTSFELIRRCRHAAAAVGDLVYVYGGLRSVDTSVEYLVEASAAEAETISAAIAAAKARKINGDVEQIQDSDDGVKAVPTGKQNSTLIMLESAMLSSILHGVQLHHRAVVVAAETGSALDCMVRQLSIDQFENEGRRVCCGTAENATAARKLFDQKMSINTVPKKVIAQLLKPRGWKPPVCRQFFLDCNEIGDLCDTAEHIFSNEPSVLVVKAPVKIFGDLHGQFGDLMRLFDEYGSPSTAGDIAYVDYLFLGDYVDRGQHSLETIVLLLALKVEYLHNIHLIRGNHEAADINALFGFRIECIERLGERDGIWAWHRFNRLFNWLPLAALIEKKIICMHGGIGRSINHVEQIENLQRPVAMEAGSVVLMDLLWSDPTENDSVEGLRPNARGPGLVSFGPDRVMEFCNANDVQLIVRAHECVMDGFERFAQGHLITLFSATNYCGTANNAGAILVLGRDLVVVPKLIHPLPPAISSPEASPKHTEHAWMQELNANRPPTPVRGRPQGTNDHGSHAWI
ncbi:hypothetical protein AAG906_020070 [Vitis piasezkii]